MPAKKTVNNTPSSAHSGPTAGSDENNGLFTLGTWAGLPQHRCGLCAWDTLEGEAAMLEHLRVVHLPPPEPPRTIIPVYDRFGNLKNGE